MFIYKYKYQYFDTNTNTNICNTKNIIHNDFHANIDTKIEISNKDAHQVSMLRLGLTLLLIWLNMNTHHNSNIHVSTNAKYNRQV